MKDTREDEILTILQEKQSATIEELAASLYTSPSTVRRKLNALQEKGLLTRTHGGAKIKEERNFFPTFSFRSRQNSYEKKKIALAAIKLIEDGNLIFLDGSTSAFYIAEYLKDFKSVRVITNGIDTISLLSKNGINAYSTGGRVSAQNRAVLVGQPAINTVKNFHADLMFFSAQSVNRAGEISDCFEEENYVRQAMMENSEKSVFLCDSTKTNRTSPYKLCSVGDISHVVCNTDAAGFFAEKYGNKIIGSNFDAEREKSFR
ncbi:MAG: DeoR/GlpR transcriptional regulator [Clostridia bacterium]|nr:DeoR/GlpR transcriptional regulator [Clostridia bacterium]